MSEVSVLQYKHEYKLESTARLKQGASWDAPLDPTSSLVTPVWAPCKLFNIPYVTKIYGHFRPKIAISSQDNYVIKPVRFIV